MLKVLIKSINLIKILKIKIIKKATKEKVFILLFTFLRRLLAPVQDGASAGGGEAPLVHRLCSALPGSAQDEARRAQNEGSGPVGELPATAGAGPMAQRGKEEEQGLNKKACQKHLFSERNKTFFTKKKK